MAHLVFKRGALADIGHIMMKGRASVARFVPSGVLESEALLVNGSVQA